jgi:LytR cell envelope-related transcriptional attenuator
MSPKSLILNVVIVGLGILVFVLFYMFITRTVTDQPVDWKTQSGRTDAGEIIQLDVQNGCGAQGVAQKFTDYLRKRNFDVVQSSNYKTFDVEHSLVIDRTGIIDNAKKVAHALGISEDNVVQQVNPDYHLHVSVIIGKDYNVLKPLN